MEGVSLQRVTKKQREILPLLKRGHTSKEIAQILGVSASAINQRIGCMLRNNGLRDRRELSDRDLQTSDRTPAEPPQVAPPLSCSTQSATDQMRSSSDGSSPRRQADYPDPTGPQPFPESIRPSASMIGTDLRSVVEAVFFAMMTILGACAMLKQVLL